MQPNSEPIIRIVIPTYNRAEDLTACLESLKQAGIRGEQIIIIDNASQDDTSLMINRHHPDVTLKTMDRNLGASGASNAGFEIALKQGADYILRLDSDTIVAPGFLAPLLEVALKDPKIGLLSPKIYYYKPNDEIWYAGADSHPWHFGTVNGHRHEKDSPENNRVREVDYVWGAAMLIKKDVLETTGGFDTDFFVYYEEVDFCQRVQNLGYSLLYVPDSVVWHKVGSITYSNWTAYHWNRSKMIFYRKHARSIIHQSLLVAYSFYYALVTPILKGKSGNRGPLTSAIKGLIDGLRKNY